MMHPVMPTPKTNTNKHGQTATMNTANIGQRKPEEIRVAEIKALAKQGNRAEQIADALGVGEQQVRVIAKRNGTVYVQNTANIGQRSGSASLRIVGDTYRLGG